MHLLKQKIARILTVAVLSISIVFSPIGTNAQIPVLSTVVADAYQVAGNLYDSVSDAFWKAWEAKDKFLEETAAVAFRQGVRTLLTQLANDVGEWVGSGGKGQSPLFHEDGFGAYLTDAVDTASGVMIDDILSSGYLEGFNLCEPSFQVQLGINLGLADFEPARPTCKFSTLRSNWEQAIRTENFLPDFRQTFDPSENDLGIALTMQNNILELENEKKEASILARIEEGGFKGVTSLISDQIRTPAKKVESKEAETDANASSGELSFTRSVIADSVDVFLNAVARSMLTNLMQNGLGGGGGSRSDRTANLFNPDAQGGVEGAVAARARLAQSINPSFAIPGRYNIVSQLVDCSNPSNPGVNNCVIDDNFATAINRRLTVKQAVEDGLLRGDRPFGFLTKDDSLEPSVGDGIPYRSILILRTYRIVPVGWEIAARHIGKFSEKIVTLNELMDAYDNSNSDYFGLVDPNWVLVPPDAFCKLAGPGPEITYSTTVPGVDTNKDGDFDDIEDTKPKLEFQRDANYCADEQTCIATDDSGACKFYGYCLEERPSLEFNASSCEPRYSTCTTLENTDTGTTVSYLLNTVDFADCTANSVGCKKYASWQRLNVPVDSDIRWDADRADLRPVYLNSRAEECDASDSGCHAYIRLTGLSDNNDSARDTNTNTTGIQSEISGKLTVAIENGVIDAPTTSLHLKRAPEWMGCRGCQAAGLGGDLTIVDIEDVNKVNGWRGGCGAERSWPCDDGSVSTEDLEQVAIAFEQGTCSTECRAYAPFCSEAQVGCMAYTPTNGNPTITAVSGEQCPAQCVGFDVYTQNPTFFERAVSFAEFIPSTAQSCQVSEAGCTAFTNLAKEGQGGEAREYYQSLRLCQLPGQGESAIYYTWEGSDDTGFQLRSFELKASNITTAGAKAPCTNLSWSSGTASVCSDPSTITEPSCNADNFQQNPDCRQFYTTSGTVFYRLLSRTIIVDNACTPLRKTTDPGLTNPDTACTASSGYWDGAACIYQALTSQSKSCSASAAGCRLYQGGTSANYQTLLSVDFETDAGGFTGGQLSSVSSNVGGHSYRLPASSGSSRIDLPLSGGESTQLENSQLLPASYIVSLNARSVTGNPTITIGLYGGVDSDGDLVDLKGNRTDTIDDTWRTYTFDAFSVSPLPNRTSPYILDIKINSGTVYVDNVTINTSVDTFAVIKNSWSTPSSCFGSFTIQNNIDLSAPIPVIDCNNGWEGVESGVLPTVDYQIRAIAHGDASDPCISGDVCEGDFNADEEVQVDELILLTNFLDGTKSWQCYTPPVTASRPLLGCQQYQVSNGTTQNVHRFGNSCEPKFVGCEALIDTQNLTTGSNPYQAKGLSGATSCEFRPAVAANPSAIPPVSARGAGWYLPSSTASSPDCSPDVVVPADTVDYLVNQTQYRCNGAQQGCTALGLSNADPVTQDVQWSTTYLLNNPDRYSSILCGANEVECSAFSDGRTTYYFKDPKSKTCEYRTDKPTEGWYRRGSAANEPDCTGGQQKTFAAGSVAAGPTPGWTGSCPAAVNSCTEYIDPISSGNANLLENGRFVIGTASVPPTARSWRGEGFVTWDANRGARVAGTGAAGNEGLYQSVRLKGSTLHTVSATVKNDGPNIDYPFVGLACEFNTANRPTVRIHCPNLQVGGFAFEPGDALFGNEVSKAIANARTGCKSSACQGDLSNDGVVDANEIQLLVMFVSGNVNFECGEGYRDLFASPDPSFFRVSGNQLYGGGTYVALAPGETKQLSMRVSLPAFRENQNVNCRVQIGDTRMIPVATDGSTINLPTQSTQPLSNQLWFSEVALRESNTYYQLSNLVDKGSCGGTANAANCVLLNERSVNTANLPFGQTRVDTINGYNVTRWNADAEGAAATTSQWGQEYGACDPTTLTCDKFPTRKCSTDIDCAANVDSNAIVKVTPTRQCNAWLSCRTTRTVVQNGVTKQVCLEVESCLAVNDKGECIRRAPEQTDADLVFNKASIDRLKNLSGYSRAGFDWGGGIAVDGQLPIAQMSQVGETVNLINGDFESFSPAGEPAGWIGWDNGNRMKVIADPLTAQQKAGVEYPMQGLGFLEVNANSSAPTRNNLINATDLMPVGGGSTYILSAYLNTRQLSGGKAQVRVIEYATNSNASTGAKEEVLFLTPGNGWRKFAAQFTTESSTQFIRLQLVWEGQNVGYWHIDDIQIKPALRTNRGGSPQSQSCRLYPTENAPACEFFNDAGLRTVGKRGYCLTPDPKNTNFCLQWWPVDSVAGEDSGEDRAGYDGPVPLYQCLNTQDGWVTVVKPDRPSYSSGGTHDPQPFTQQLPVYADNGSGLERISENTDAELDRGESYIIDAMPSDGRVFGDNYNSGGLVDKVGTCKAMATTDSEKEGCEIAIWVERHDSGDSYVVKVVSASDGTEYEVMKWNEREPLGNVGDAWYVDGSKVETYIDLAWVKDPRTKEKVYGPFSKVIIRNTAEEKGDILGVWVRPVFSCTSVVQVVRPDGQTKGYQSRIIPGSIYRLNMSKNTTAPISEVEENSPNRPFGSVLPPQPIDTPGMWDSSTLVGRQSVYPYDIVDGKTVSAGVPRGCVWQNFGGGFFPSNISRCAYYGGYIDQDTPTKAMDNVVAQLFVETYGVWEWKPQNDGSFAYERSDIPDLRPLTSRCAGPTRTATDGSCGIPPVVQEIKLSRTNITDIGSVTLSFATNVDKDQLPIVAYRVDWGDGTKTTQSGLKLQNRTSDNPITLTHNYSYDLLANSPANCVATTCIANPNDFIIRPRVQIIDNWGWCNGVPGFHTSSGQCTANGTGWTSAPSTITIED